ncbi:MAG: HNH endonuclease [Bacteroidota bacterium]
MKKTIRDFIHHYHKTRKVFQEIIGKDKFSLNITFQKENLTARSSTPDPEVSIRFALLMRRFLYPKSELYYENIVKLIQENSPDLLDEEKVSKITSYINFMKQGPIGIQVNGEFLSAENIYTLISEGIFFNNETNSANYLHELSNVPITGPLFWHQFYSYTVNGFYLVSGLFDLVSEVKEIKFNKDNLENDQTKNQKCIYCLSSDKSFHSEEHIIPEALGNDEAILPKGFVCDECNNGVLSILDEYLIKFEPIAFLQVQYVPYLKSGRLPKANFQNMSIKKTHPRHIEITAKDKTANISNKKELDDGMYSWNFNFRGKPIDPVRLGRSLYKIGLGFIALDLGHDVALSKKYEKTRKFINGEANFQNYLLIRNTIQPRPQVRVTHKEANLGSIFVVDIFGLIFVFNLEEQPKIELNDILEKSEFAKYNLE